MLQLVTEQNQRSEIHPKINLICDVAKVEEILGVRPNQVIDVMALRGDSVITFPVRRESATKARSI